MDGSVLLYGRGMLDIHRLRVFGSVVASGSVQGAAANLLCTSSVVGQHITALQCETGLVLFERVGGGFCPTPAGFAVAAEADGVLVRLGEALPLRVVLVAFGVLGSDHPAPLLSGSLHMFVVPGWEPLILEGCTGGTEALSVVWVVLVRRV